MSTDLDATLARFGDTDVTVRLLWGLMSAIPGAPDMVPYTSLAEARLCVAPELDDEGFARAERWCSSAAARRMLSIADALDTGDVGISVVSGLRTALGLFFGQGAKALDTDPQQGADAALKALGLGAIVHAVPGATLAERVANVRAMPAGSAMLHYYVAAELALPFGDDLAQGATSVVTNLLEKHGGTVVKKLEGFIGGGTGPSANEAVAALLGPFDEVAVQTRDKVGAIAEKAASFLPPAIAAAGTVAGAVATGADTLPVWRLLGARLVAETALRHGWKEA